MPPRVAVFVDGENLSTALAPQIAGIAADHGTADLARVYGNAAQIHRWGECPGFQLVHSGTGKNATDLLLAIDAMEVAMGRAFQAIVIASSDRDFTHLAVRLREKNLAVIGIGEAKTAERFRAACTAFHEVVNPAPAQACSQPPAGTVSELDLEIRAVIRAHTIGDRGIYISLLGHSISKRCNIRARELPEKTWRGYLGKRETLYEMDPKGPQARVRYLPRGFAGCQG